MISFNNIGHMGRLGNQMFQYAALRGIAAHNGYDYSSPQEKIMLTDCFKIPKTKGVTNSQMYSLDGIEFNKEFFDNCPDNVDLYGFFQSEKYFQNIEGELRKDFTFYDNVQKMCKTYVRGMFGSSKVISMHIRRTDFITDSQFYTLDLKYYKTALTHFDHDTPVIIVSDDPQWCKENFKGERFFISTSSNLNVDMCLMSLCDYHVIANSSFSWWGSWLAKSKKTVAPSRWFSSDGQFKDWSTEDLYNSNWTLICT